MNIFLKQSCFAIALLLLWPFSGARDSLCRAADKSGVTPNTISLPSGPGSIEGLGESFQPMLNTGTAKYAVKIALPAGVNGHTPSLSLAYESGFGEGPAGIGWKFGPGDVSRRTDKGIPRYVDGPNGLDDDHDGEIDEPDEVDRFIGTEGEELVRLVDATYRARIEGNFTRYNRVRDESHDHWEGRLRDGTKLEFGLTPQARVADEKEEKVFKWLLEKSTDTNGNSIEYFYASFPGSDNQKYLKEIRYGPGSGPWEVFYFAHLSYEDRPDWRKDYRSGFLIKTAKRLSQIDIGIQGAVPDQCAPGDWNLDGETDALIARYSVSYDKKSVGSSYLSEVKRYGSDGVNYLPPITFSYSTFDPDTTVSAQGAVLGSTNEPFSVMDSQLVEVIDLNRDGLPDLLKTDLEGGQHTGYLNLGVQGEGSSRSLKWDSAKDVTSADGLALQLYLSENEVHLADMNGDGLSDLVHTAYGGEVSYYLNQGSLSWGKRTRMLVQDSPPPAPFGSDRVKTLDLDFDKRMDLVRSSENGYSIWFNLAENKYSQEVRTAGAIHQGAVIQLGDNGVRLADMNGDRMSDAAKISPLQVTYCANMGHGQFDSSVTISIPDSTLTEDQVKRAQLEDINGDGLADLVIERAGGNELWYFLNLGTDAFSQKHTITNMPIDYGENVVTRWADMNGNGTVDLVYADSTADSRIRILDIGELVGGSSHSNLLTEIQNGLGVTTRIAYQSSTEFYVAAREAGEPWSTTIPFPVQVVSEVRVATGLDCDDVLGVDEYRKKYTYRDGFYEDREKAFRGFSQVEVTEFGDPTAPTRITTHRFFTGGPDGVDNDQDGEIDEVSPLNHREEDALKGMVRGVEVRGEDGLLFSEVKHDWLVRCLALSVDNIEVRFAYNQKEDKLVYEGTNTPETIRSTYEYDDFGNVTEERHYGALSITGDEAFTFTEYINDTSLWMLGFQKRSYVTDRSGQKFSETFTYYDGPDYTGLVSGGLTKGNLTRKEGWVNAGKYVDLVRNAYDVYGNITSTLNPNGYRRTVVYDSILHSYPIQESIEVGGGKSDLTTAATYNLGLGVVISSSDFNGHQTFYVHDAFGRLTAIIRSADSMQFPTLAFSYTMTDPGKGLIYSYDVHGVLALSNGSPAPSSIQTRAREVSGQPGTFDTIEYVDGMGRKLAAAEEGKPSCIIKEAVRFNAMGTVRSAFLPYYAMSIEYKLPASDNAKVETHYDVVGREILRIHPPDANNIVTSSTTAHAPLKKTVTDETGKSRISLADGRGRLVEVHEQNKDETCVTRYSYDPLGSTIRVADAQNNTKTTRYDGLKRRVGIDDPDRGHMDYDYDDGGNVTRTIDNKGQAIIYAYDGANRILAEDYLDANHITPDVSYHYDKPSEDYPSAENTKGQLSWIRDPSGGVFHSFDERGNKLWSVKRIVDNGNTYDFRSEFAYDAMDRLILMVFPDGDQVNFTYNDRSLLKSISQIANAIDYNASGAIESVVYGNGVKSHYTHDQRNRLTKITTTSPRVTDPIQALEYNFDGASNITSVIDLRVLPAGSPQNATQAFLYDDLYRLTHAEGVGYGAISYQYDKIGNMTFKSSPPLPEPKHINDPWINLGFIGNGGRDGTIGRGAKLPGDPAGPHAITATESGLLFDYDDNGNMSYNAGDLYEWDFKDRLTSVKTQSSDSHYTYDHRGQRVLKRVMEGDATSSTYFITREFEIRDGRAIKHLFAGERRIAQVDGVLTESGGRTWQLLNFREGWNFFSLCVEPDNPAISTALEGLAGTYTEIYGFDAVTQQYKRHVSSQGITDLEEIHAHNGYIIRMTGPASLLISGRKVTTDLNLLVGWNLIPCPADSSIPVTDAFASIAGKYEAVWSYDAASLRWQSFLPGKPTFLSDLAVLEPGKAYWIKTEENAQVVFQKRVKQIYFYHHDHLGSSNIITDEKGDAVQELSYFPYGRERYPISSSGPPYLFSGKEMDRQTALYYFGARYYSPGVSRWMSVDPVSNGPGFFDENSMASSRDFQESANSPSSLAAYGYCANNPIRYIDPEGLTIRYEPEYGSTSHLSDPQSRQALREIDEMLFKNQVANMERYIQKAGFSQLIQELHSRKETITVKETSKVISPQYDPGSKTILINPLFGTVVGPQAGPGQPRPIQSPALGLLHEYGHALRHLKDPKGFFKDLRTLDPTYDNREDRRVIVNIETPAAGKLGEPTRAHHNIMPVRVQSPVSKEPEDLSLP